MGHTVKRCPKAPKDDDAGDTGGFSTVGAADAGFDTPGGGDGFGAGASSSGFEKSGFDGGITAGGGAW